MNIFNKNLIGLVLIFVFMVGFVLPIPLLAATTPSLGAAASYGILSSTYTNTSAGTTINGDVGFTTGPAVAPLGTHTNYGSGAPYSTAGAAQGSALALLSSQACTFAFAGGAINLSTDTTHGAIGMYTPGVYCVSGAMNVGGPLTLVGSGTYIFRSTGALTSTAGATVNTSGASACDVFWTPDQATTLAANTTFFGNLISNAGVTIGANTTWLGRSLAFGGTVTSDTTTINTPSCSVPSVYSTPYGTPYLTPYGTPYGTPYLTPYTYPTPSFVPPVVPAPVVVVPVVALPQTGSAPMGMNMAIPLSIMIASIVSVVLVLRKKSI